MERIRDTLLLVLFVLMVMLCAGKPGVQAAETAFLYTVSGNREEGQRLIQSVGVEEEYSGMLHLGLLKVRPLEEPELASAVKLVNPVIARLEDGAYYGSGVIFRMTEESIILLTSSHLLENGKKVTVTFADGWKTGGTASGYSTDTDVGFVTVPVAELPIETLRELRYVSMDEKGYDELVAGDSVFTMGVDREGGVAVHSGVIADMWHYQEEFDTWVIYQYCQARPGMSGGGTFDTKGNLIGMLTGGNGEASASIPLPTILKEYELLMTQ